MQQSGSTSQTMVTSLSAFFIWIGTRTVFVQYSIFYHTWRAKTVVALGVCVCVCVCGVCVCVCVRVCVCACMRGVSHVYPGEVRATCLGRGLVIHVCPLQGYSAETSTVSIWGNC